ncbi:MAG: cell division protein FtsQ/DivIB [Bdellovibrionota bacterium]
MKPSIARPFILIGVPAALALVILIFAGMELRSFLLTSPRFAVKEVVLLTSGKAQKENILRLAGISPNMNIFALDLDRVRKSVEREPWVHSATVVRALPNKIEIQYEPQVPVAILGAGSMYYLNKEGRPFYKIQKGDSLIYPLVQVEGGFKNSELSRKRVETGLRILQTLKTSPIFSEKDLGELTVRMDAEDGSAPYALTLRFPPRNLTVKGKQPDRLYTASFGEEDLGMQVKHWEAVLRHLVQTGKNPRLIRLELGKKVVVKLER